MSTPQLDRRLVGALLRIPFQYIVTEIHAGLADAGFADLSPSHFVVFQNMRTEGVRSTDLARKAQVSKQAMGQLVAFLESRDYVERVPDPTDGRAQLVRLSERGWEVARVAFGVVERIEAEWEEYLSSERMQQLRSILRELVALVGES